MFAIWVEIGNMLSWSSMATQFLQDARDRMNLEIEQNQIYCTDEKLSITSQRGHTSR